MSVTPGQIEKMMSAAKIRGILRRSLAENVMMVCSGVAVAALVMTRSNGEPKSTVEKYVGVLSNPGSLPAFEAASATLKNAWGDNFVRIVGSVCNAFRISANDGTGGVGGGD